jgi:hypothetical protein
MRAVSAILRMFRLLITGLSLLLCLGLSLLWMRSYHTVDTLVFPQRDSDGTTYYRMGDSYGGVVNWSIAAGGYLGFAPWHTTMFGPGRRWEWTHSPWYVATNGWNLPKFRYRSTDLKLPHGRHVKAHDVRAPYWALLAVAILPLLFRSSRVIGYWRRRRRRARGLCARCGYDLRGGQDVCPECGTGKIDEPRLGQWVAGAMQGRRRKARVFAAALAVLVLSLAAVLHARHAQQQKDKYQKIVDEAPWHGPDQDTDMLHCINLASGCQVGFTGTPARFFNNVVIRVSRGGKEIYSWKGHEFSVFLESSDQLVYADYLKDGTGCTLVAVDLNTGHQIWRNALQALGGDWASPYSNRVRMVLRDGCIFVYGDESFGRYLEIVDFNGGETLAHRVFAH